jgi:hypothetical protein
MIVLSVVTYREATDAMDAIDDSMLHGRHHGKEFPIHLSGGRAMWAKMVLCTQQHPEVDEPRCRVEIVGKVTGKH